MVKIEVEFFEDIAEEVRELHQAMLQLKNSRLTEEAVITLLVRSTGENQSTVKRVLYGLETINKYLK